MSNMITLYGIKNCDTVKRARERLDQEGIAYRFHDFKVEGLTRELAQSWIDALGMDVVVNRKGTMWRTLDDATKNSLTETNAAELLSRVPSLVKRPVFEYKGGHMIGFPKTDEQAILDRLR